MRGVPIGKTDCTISGVVVERSSMPASVVERTNGSPLNGSTGISIYAG